MKKAKSQTPILIISGILTVLICAVMNFYLIPLIESSAQSMRMFDMNTFGYSFEQAKAFVSQLSEESLNVYLSRQLPLDFLYPVAYTVFFSLALVKLMPEKKMVVALPVALMICDYCENILSIVMLKTDFSKAVATFASMVTIIKSMIMYVVIILIIVLFIIRLVKKK